MSTQTSFPFDLDPHAHDSAGYATSLLHSAEFVLACLDAVDARTLIEVGSFIGDLTQLLVLRAAQTGGQVTAIDTMPHPELNALADAEPALSLYEGFSHHALEELPIPDAIVLDGDHNHWTVSGELAIIARRVAAEESAFPLLICHDVGWPHGRRDDYYVPENVPAEHRQPLARAGLYPGDPGTRHGGIPCDNPAAREGGPANGVLTAIEQYLVTDERLRLAIVPGFFGVGIIWDTTGPHDAALARVLDRWDRNPLLQRMEDNRILHLVNVNVLATENAEVAARVAARDEVLARRGELLAMMRDSRVMRAIGLVSRLRGREPMYSEQRIERALR